MPDDSRSRLKEPIPEADEGSSRDVSVIIVSYNVRDFTKRALQAVEQASEGLGVEVFVVDNNSQDDSAEMVRRQFPDVHLIENDANVGFSRACNQALRRAQGRYALLLNPDTLVQPDTLHVLAGFLEAHPEAGAVGGQICNPDGTFAPASRRAFPTPAVAFYRMVGLSRLFPNSRRFGRYNLTYLPKDEVTEVDALSGSCMMVRRAALCFSQETWKRKCRGKGKRENGRAIQNRHSTTTNREGAGLLDEDFFMYGEDLDWCYRIQQAGWKIYYTPETKIIHFKGESTRQGDRHYVRLFYRAMLQFADKHFQDRYGPLFVRFLKTGIRARAALAIGRRWVRDLLRRS